MRSDSEIQRDVEAELAWTPGLNETDIAVKVSDSIVTLTGYAANYAEKYRAEAAAKRVLGVAAVANDLAVRTPLGGMPTDPEIAREAVTALKIELPIHWEQIRPIVHEGHVALEGTAEWHDQRERAEAAVRRVQGVMSVRNSIKLKRHAQPQEDIKHNIEEAFRRNAIIDAQRVSVQIHGGEVILRGQVSSWAEREQARRAAWAAPGVSVVKDELVVRT
ncbi:MAG TPA: BON domain-containing protein [Steroidobacteraceae bacterium]|nr:BON domain-containing protein [Steroidobacteraceae bacterium]